MPNLMADINDLKGMPDQALQFELANPSGAMPAYLVLAEAQRRQTMRQAAQAQQSQQPVGSVYDDVIRDMMARQPPQGMAPAGMTPPPMGQPASPAAGNFRAPQPGKPLGMAKGGTVSVDDYNPIIESAAQDNGLDPNFLRSVIYNESTNDPNAVSNKGATGLMQLMPDTAREEGVTDINDPEQNIRAGAHYLGKQVKDFGSQDLGLAAYNAGPAVVRKYHGVPPYKETRDYIQKVNARLAYLNKQSQSAVNKGDATRIASDSTAQATAKPAPAPSQSTDYDYEASQMDPLTKMQVHALYTPPGTVDVPPAAPGPTSMAPPPVAPLTASTQRDDTGIDWRADEKQLHDYIKQMYAQTQQKPTIWQALQNLGYGMATSHARTWSEGLGAGLANMTKGAMDYQEQQRQRQLQLMGVSLKLDQEAQQHEEKIQAHQDALARINATAQNQAATQAYTRANAAYQNATKMPGAFPGGADERHPGFALVTNPADLSNGFWVPSGRTVLKDSSIIPYLGVNPETGKPYQIGDAITQKDLAAGNAKMGTTAEKQATQTAKPPKAPTQFEWNAQTGIAQTLQKHSEFQPPTNPDGTPKQFKLVTDLPENLQNEALWRIRILRDGWSPKTVQGLLADPTAPADLVAAAKSFQTNAATQAGAMTTARTTAGANAKQAAKAKQQATEGAVLTPAGQKIMGETDNVGSSIDQLIDLLSQPQYAHDNNPFSTAGAWAKYRMGIASSDEDELGQALSKLSLTSVQGAMPYASKSRAMKWINMVLTHLPNPPMDSPENMLAKLKTARRGILGIERSALQWENKGAGQNAPAPLLTPERGQMYLRLADGDQKKAIQMAKEDGWGFPAVPTGGQ